MRRRNTQWIPEQRTPGPLHTGSAHKGPLAASDATCSLQRKSVSSQMFGHREHHRSEKALEQLVCPRDGQGPPARLRLISEAMVTRGLARLPVTCVCMHTYIKKHTGAQTHGLVCMSKHTCLYIFMHYVHMHTCGANICTCMFACVSVYVSVFVCYSVCIYLHVSHENHSEFVCVHHHKTHAHNIVLVHMSWHVHAHMYHNKYLFPCVTVSVYVCVRLAYTCMSTCMLHALPKGAPS